MKILITGAAGFIGANFVYHLLENRPDWEITALDALTYAGNLENLKSPLEAKQIKFEKVDICDEEDLARVFSSTQFDQVYHFAAESHVDRSILSPNEFVRTNVLGTQNLINNARKYEVSKFIHVSTDEVYGTLGETGRFVEETPLDPSSAYSASKAGSDMLVLAAFRTHGFNAVVTRCTNNYGPYQFPEKLIPLVISNVMEDKKLPLYGDGTNVRSWIYVRDHCEAVLRVGEKGAAGEVYNIGGPLESEVPNKEIMLKILSILGKSEDLIEYVTDRLGHDFRYAVDSSKLKNATDWEPSISLNEGLETTINWYKENTEWWQKIKSGEYMKYYEKNYGDRS